MKRARPFKIALIAVTALGVVSAIVMELWNVLLPGLFAGVRPISFWQAMGLLILCKLLFGGLRPPFGGGRRWRERMIQRWEQMTPEEREKFRQGMRHGCFTRRDQDAGERKAEVRA